MVSVAKKVEERTRMVYSLSHCLIIAMLIGSVYLCHIQMNRFEARLYMIITLYTIYHYGIIVAFQWCFITNTLSQLHGFYIHLLEPDLQPNSQNSVKLAMKLHCKQTIMTSWKHLFA